jgi:hypothetical protein
MIDNSKLIEGLATHLVDNHLSVLAEGKVLQVTNVQMQLANKLNRRCIELLHERDNFEGSIVTLSNRTNAETYEKRAEEVVELRNQIQHSLVVFIPQEYSRSTQSIASFKSISIVDVMEELSRVILKVLGGHGTLAMTKNLVQVLSQNKSIEDWLLLLLDSLEVSNPIGYFLSNLWRIDLIPDTVEQSLDYEAILRNLDICRTLSTRGNPLQTPIERFDELDLIRDNDWEKLRNLLITNDSNLSTWKELIQKSQDENLLFSNWKFKRGKAATIHSLEVQPFMGISGKVKKTFGVSQNPSGDFIANRGFVKIEWITNPSRIDADFHWKIEIMSSIDLDVAESEVEVFVIKTKSSFKANLEALLGDSLDEYYGRRICIRLSAVDDSSTVLTKSDGESAVSYSEPFIVVKVGEEDPTNPGVPRATKCFSLAEVGLLAVIDNNVTKEDILDKPFETALNLPDQTLTVYCTAPYLVDINSYMIKLQKLQLENPDKIYSYVDEINRIYPNGRTPRAIEILGLSKEFIQARKDFFKCLTTNTKLNQAFIESVFWEPEICDALERYVQIYLQLLDTKQLAPNLEGALLSIDTLEIEIETNLGLRTALVLLPLHPLRALWLRDHSLAIREIAKRLLTLPVSERKKNVDMNLVRQVLPINYPFVLTKEMQKFVHSYETSFGTGVFLQIEDRNNLQIKESINRLLGIQKTEKYSQQIASRMTEHLLSYLNTTEQAMGIRVAMFNAGTATLAAEALTRVRAQTLDSDIPKRFEVIGYSSEEEGSSALKDLRKLAEEINKESNSEGGLFRPELSLRINHLSKLNSTPEATNISILHGASKSEITAQDSEVSKFQRDGLFDGLITYLFSYSIENEEGVTHYTTPTILRQSDRKVSLQNVHHAFTRLASKSEYGYSLRLPLGLQQKALIDQVHSLSDWVITLDTFIGPALYEDVLSSSKSGIVVIDYSPEFVDGFGDRLTLTTTKYFEITRIIRRAMLDLGLEDQGITARDVLRGLSSISGRLAMRLLGNNSLATEAVGLFAVHQFLNTKGLLRDHIIIPVDAHQEVFSPKRHDDQRDNDRCDLLLVKVKDDDFEISFVEVKTRTSRFIDDLPGTMATQMENTSEWLRHLLFDAASSRVDQSLQWSRWASLLHFYADRSRLHGFITPDEIGGIHGQISRICERRIRPTKMVNKGFIVCLDFEGSKPESVNLNMELEVLNETKVRELSFVTTKEMTEKGVEIEKSPILNSSSQQVAPPDKSDVAPSTKTPNDRKIYPQVSIEGKKVELNETVQVSDLGESPSSQTEMHSEQRNDDDPKAIEVPKDFQIHLGTDTAEQIVEWNLSVKGSPHGLIAGVSGHGKSVTTRNIVQGFANASVPTIIFDFHGEMSEISGVDLKVIDVGTIGLPFSPFGFNKEIPMPITAAAQEISEILRNIGGLGDIQTAHVRASLVNIYDAKNLTDQNCLGQELPTIQEFVMELERVQANNRGRNALERLNWFTSFGLFRENSQLTFNALDPRGTVFDLSRYPQEEVKLTAGSFILKKIYNEMFLWGKSERLRLSLILDEAHRLASDPTIPKLMKEGRKYGVSLLLASQNLDDFAPEVVQNAGLRVAFRNNHPASRKIASLLNQRDSINLAHQIERLGVGTAIVVTETIKNPRVTRMRRIDS